MSKIVCYEVFENGELYASVEGPEKEAFKEACRYIAEVLRDGQLPTVYLVTRKQLKLEVFSAS